MGLNLLIECCRVAGELGRTRGCNGRWRDQPERMSKPLRIRFWAGALMRLPLQDLQRMREGAPIVATVCRGARA